jgi:hypothetical protein
VGVQVIVNSGKLVLCTGGRMLFPGFDGPGTRKIFVLLPGGRFAKKRKPGGRYLASKERNMRWYS